MPSFHTSAAAQALSRPPASSQLSPPLLTSMHPPSPSQAPPVATNTTPMPATQGKIPPPPSKTRDSVLINPRLIPVAPSPKVVPLSSSEDCKEMEKKMKPLPRPDSP
ncbi:lysine-rich arabinogalactan protein 19-like [Rosa chinensis]|uniref:lysine-rich arabinogalactan protein 19-like n=1 Tax=Rosa chinensis TaxID=74649 RepID=UPI000D08BA68|nr:lysine-rich arabinogalactan protein 19-like [Rosa chinensis]